MAGGSHVLVCDGAGAEDGDGQAEAAAAGIGEVIGQLEAFDEAFVFSAGLLAGLAAERAGGEHALADKLAMFTQPAWSKLKIAPEDVPEAEFRHDMAVLVGSAAEQLAQAFAARAASTQAIDDEALRAQLLAAIDELVTPAAFDALLGMVQANQMGVRRPSVVASALESGALEWAEVCGDLTALRDAVIATQASCGEDSDGDGDDEHEHEPIEVIAAQYPAEFAPEAPAVDQVVATDMFVALDGSAVFPLLAGINHACRPNAKVTYEAGDDGAAVCGVLVALCDLAPGDEVFISYLPDVEFTDATELSLEERTEIFADYGFVCGCSLCMAGE